ncbi:MAG: DUF5110 domain-containing protein [Candidatus Heimdallarchaeota archaeon]|nr:DUF5110 domain-containing protein [Candidatus Heimdallarchaeota archaeon]
MELDNRFVFDCKPVAKKDTIIQGANFRITVLTSRLFRLEYDSGGIFEDRPTQAIWFRDLDKVEFEVERDNGILYIRTEFLKLSYKENQKFSASSLEILVNETKTIWKYGKKDNQNLGGTARTLDMTWGSTKLSPGLLSRNGYAVLDDSHSLVFNDDFWIESRIGSEIDIYFFGHGQMYIECLQDYYKISGKPSMIPRYVLGNWWSRYWEYTQEGYKVLIESFEDHDLPLSVAIIDMDWHLVNIEKKYGSGWTGFTWNKDLFPEPKELLEWLHNRDLKVSLNLHPALGIRAHEEAYPEIAKVMGVDITKEEPVEFDVTDRKFMIAYFDLVLRKHENLGIDFWWMDYQQSKKSKLPYLDPLWMVNHTHFLDMGRDITRSFIFSRWGNQGHQRYPIGFSGDTFVNWKVLQFQPYFTITASNIGYGWWSHDIGGHMLGKEDTELYIRWVQFGVFSPIFRLHSTKNAFHRREPWRHDYNALRIVGDFMRLRHQLIPYLYSMAHLGYKEGLPLMQPMYYHDQDNRAYQFKNQYWFGTEMIVSPITTKLDKKVKHVMHKTYLPDGVFYDFFNYEHNDGNRILNRPYRLDQIPIFAKAGAIIPMDADSNNGVANPSHIIVSIFPGANNTFHLYEDDGETKLFKDGEYDETTITQQIGDKVTITIDRPTAKFAPSDRKWTLKFIALSSYSEVKMSIDDQPAVVEMNECGLCKTIEVQHDFLKLSISFDYPIYIQQDFVFSRAFDMLMLSDIGTIKKNHLKATRFKQIITEKDYPSIMRKIKWFQPSIIREIYYLLKNA